MLTQCFLAFSKNYTCRGKTQLDPCVKLFSVGCSRTAACASLHFSQSEGSLAFWGIYFSSLPKVGWQDGPPLPCQWDKCKSIELQQYSLSFYKTSKAKHQDLWHLPVYHTGLWLVSILSSGLQEKLYTPRKCLSSCFNSWRLRFFGFSTRTVMCAATDFSFLQRCHGVFVWKHKTARRKTVRSEAWHWLWFNQGKQRWTLTTNEHSCTVNVLVSWCYCKIYLRCTYIQIQINHIIYKCKMSLYVKTQSI